jgi:hypothetical protein
MDAGIDGFNLAYSITPGSFVDFIDGVVPILQARGLVQKQYAAGTYREKIYGAGQNRLPASHPGAIYRGLGVESGNATALESVASGTETAKEVTHGVAL